MIGERERQRRKREREMCIIVYEVSVEKFLAIIVEFDKIGPIFFIVLSISQDHSNLPPPSISVTIHTSCGMLIP